MHWLGFLGRVLPEFRRLTCQVQDDLYHKYTTDEHTLRALDVLDAFADWADSKHSPYRKVLNEIHDSSSLYFAVLMHDTGRDWARGIRRRARRLSPELSTALDLIQTSQRRFRRWCGIIS